MSGRYEKLDELRRIYGWESIEEILDGIIDRITRINRIAELQPHQSLRWGNGREGALRETIEAFISSLERLWCVARALAI
jgi:hypothetical protein